MRVISPSKIDPWSGSRKEGERFTEQQKARAADLGIDLETCETIPINRPIPAREIWWPLGSPQPVDVYHCPVLQRGRHAIKVLTPRGFQKWVKIDGPR